MSDTPEAGTIIGEVASPPFARLPEPSTLFTERAERFQALAAGHGLAAYLLFLADVARVQARTLADAPEPTWPEADAIERSYGFGMPPLDRNAFVLDNAFTALLSRVIAGLGEVVMPELARAALGRLQATDMLGRAVMVHNVLTDAIPADSFAEHAMVAAALQVHFARLAARLAPKRLRPVGDGACPACGGPPVTSVVVGWQGAHGTRFCVCSLCATLWNYVRIKCTLCGTTKGIAYQGIDGDAGTIKAETCESCRAYVKILHQHTDPALDPVADDVASLGLDLLLRDAGLRRGAVNPFLFGY
ncbi:MAG TPA: formate dehydrogenase accessory protein FdhE [Alphaproteobacteria bacterium]|jgi:FdhE protein|nr:formate dehydrogenase accessory protein FdhE [Alphaproteobacteria bacterium]